MCNFFIFKLKLNINNRELDLLLIYAWSVEIINKKKINNTNYKYFNSIYNNRDTDF